MPTRNATLRPHRLSRLMTVLLAGALLAGCGSNPDEMVASAKDYLAQKDYSAATIQLKNALQEKGDLAEARYLLGRIYFDQGDYASAEKELSHAARAGFRPDEVSPLLAQAMLKQGKRKELIERFEAEGVVDASAKAALQTSLGDAQLAVDRVAAEKSYRAALDANPNNALAALGLARLMAAEGKVDEALAKVDTLAEEHPTVSEVHVLRAQLLFSQQRTEDGLAALALARQHNPKDQLIHLSFVSTLLSLNRVEEAEAGLAEMKKSVGAAPVTRYLQAYVDFVQGNTEAARDNLQNVQSVLPDFLPARFLAGAVYFRLNDQTLAQENLNSVLATAPGHLPARRLLVMSYLAQRDAVRAKEAIAPLLAQYPENSEVLSLAGQVHLLSGDFEKSSKYLGQLVAQQPKDSQARTRLGIAQLAQGNLNEGLADLTAASELDEKQGYADFAIVTTLLRQGQFDKALAANAELARKVPNSPLVHNLEGGIQLGKQDFPAARAAFEKALEIQPAFLAAATNLARLDIRDGNVAAARERFTRILSHEPKNAGAHLALADLALSQNDQPEVVRKHLVDAVEAAPAAIDPRRRLVGFLLQTQQNKDALAAAQELAAAVPNQPVAMQTLAAAQLANGDFEQALSNLNRVVASNPERAEVWVDLARAQLATSDTRAAGDSLDKALAIEPRLLDARRLRVGLLIKGKQYDEGVAVSRDLQTLVPESADGFMLEGDVYAARNQWEKALVPYRKAFQLTSTATTAIKLHAALAGSGKSGEAAALQTKWLKDNPKDLPMLTYLAERALNASKLDDAHRWYKSAHEVAPQSAAILNNLAWVADKLGEPGAKDYIEKALEMEPDSPAILDTAGMMAVRRGDLTSGVAQLEKAHRLAPSEVSITVNLAQSYRRAGKPEMARKLLTDARAALQEDNPAISLIDALLKTL